MASWMPAFVQKRLLRYALSHVGLLDVDALDLDSLGIHIGRSSTVELKNVGLRLDELSSLVQLPPNVRLVAARVLLLRLTVPANFFHQSIVAQVDGIHVQVAVDDPPRPRDTDTDDDDDPPRPHDTDDHKTPVHRKTNRRLHSPPPPQYDPGGRVPSTHQLARSFLQDEPLEEKQELEARFMAKSFSSDTSEESAVGTGTGLGLPGALAGFLQGIIDRVQVSINDVSFRLSDHGSPSSEHASSVLAIRLDRVDVQAATSVVDEPAVSPDGTTGKRRRVSVHGFGIHLLSKEQPSQTSDPPYAPFAAPSRSPPSSREGSPATVPATVPTTVPATFSEDRPTLQDSDTLPTVSPSIRTSLHESMSEDEPADVSESTASFGIRPGEDNVSWTSRRSQSSSGHGQMWSSFAPDEQQSSSEILHDMSSSMFLSTIDTHQSPASSPSSQAYTSPTGAQSPVFDQGSQLTVGEHHPTVEESVYDPRHFQEPPVSPADGPDLSQSIMYSHAEAESMYLSAVTHEPGSPSLAMLPGQWNASLDDVADLDPEDIGEAADCEYEDRAPTPKLQHPPGQSDSNHRPSEAAPNYTSRNIVTMQDLTIWIRESPTLSTRAESHSTEPTTDRNSMGFSTFHHQAPGAFSVYAEGARSSVRFHAPHLDDEQVPPLQQAAKTDETKKVIEIDAGPIDLQADASTLSLLHQLVIMVVPTTGSVDDPLRNDTPTSDQIPRLILRLGLLRVRLLQALPEAVVKLDDPIPWGASASGEAEKKTLLQAEVRKFDLQTTTHSLPLDGALNIGKLTLTAGTCDVVSFDQTNVLLPEPRAAPKDITITVRSRSTIQRQLVREVDMRTLPIRLNLDLVKFEEDFSAFGGLSGIVEMSSSVLSSGGSSNKQERSPQPRRSVRFEEEVLPDLSSSPQLKLNARIGGLNATLTSHACCLEFQALKTKLVYREKAVAAVIDKINVYMPWPLPSPSHPGFDVVIGNVGLFYFFAPETQDLERLLSLLTPSNDKYENDDDILLDTLLNQRKKGSVLRVNVSTLQTSVTDWDFVSHLQLLGDELSKLSAVTKYLPEDDRPGMLLLVRITDTKVQFPLNARFGLMDISLKDFQAAQVGLPALYALSIGSMRISPANGNAIVHELLPGASSEHLPMLMARMVGDEADPVVKIKFFNVCVEYSVPILLAMTDTNTAPEAEHKVEDLAASVLELSTFGLKGQTSPQDVGKLSDSAGKKLAIDVLLHECGLGLKPRDLEAKGLVLLKNTKFSTVVPPDECFGAALEIREASLYIVDREQVASPVNPASPNRAYHPDYPRRLHTHLINHGFISASSIRSAKVVVSVTEDKLEEAKYIDVELRDEFFLLETCPDSTQTLIAILNGLSPPAQSIPEPKFRTEMELMTLDDMVNSLTGDTFVRPGPAPPALFDADEELPLPEEDDLLVESDMTASLYGPVGATSLDVDDDDDFYGGGSLESDTVESLLEQDPFEMTSSPQLSDDALLHSLRKQLAPFSGNKPVTLQPFYLDDQQLDRIYGGHQTLGEVQAQTQRFPIHVRIRDVNIMWNLYDGYDWQKTRDAISHAVEEVETKLEERKLNRRRSTDYEDEEEAIIGDCLFNSIYIGVPAARDPAELRYSINHGIDVASETESYATSGISRPTQASGNRPARSRHKKRLRLHRSKSHKLGFELKGVSLDFLAHRPGGGEIQSSIDVRVTDFDIFDHVPTSTWRKFLTFYHDENNLREMMKPMVHVELLNVRPVPELAATEMTIQASLLPLRLHVDQDALEFMTRFFDFKDDSLKGTDQIAEPPFIQRLEVNTVDLCLDYKPKKVDYGGLRSGRVSEFKNFVILDTAHVRLKHAIVYGLRGFDTLHDTLSDIWTPDVIQHQLRGVLAGLGPVRPLISLGAGIRDVVAIPVREYRKDGRLVRSVQKGAFHFAKTTTSELARLGAKLAIGTQTMLQGAEDMLAPVSASPTGRTRGISNQGLTDVEEEYEDFQRAVSNYADQPLGVLQGLRSARRYLERDLLTARDAFIAVQGELLDSGSAVGAAQAVARHAPTIMLRPVIGASRAVGQTLMGVGNQVDRANVRKIEDKYKRR